MWCQKESVEAVLAKCVVRKATETEGGGGMGLILMVQENIMRDMGGHSVCLLWTRRYRPHEVF